MTATGFGIDAAAAPAGAGELLVVRGLRVRLGEVLAVDEATLSVPSGSLTALIGPNGAGKSTLFNAVTGFCHTTAGEASFAGHRLTGLAPHQIARRGLVRTFQRSRVMRRMTVLENTLVGAAGDLGTSLWHNVARPRAVRRRRHEAEAEARDALCTVGLSAKADDLAGTLSGGQSRLLELARVLMAQPSMVMLDEPLAGINPSASRDLMAQIDHIRRERGLTVLIVEHKLDVVMRHCDRVAVMASGSVIAEGEPLEISRSEKVLDAYLGQRRSAQGSLAQGSLAQGSLS